MLTWKNIRPSFLNYNLKKLSRQAQRRSIMAIAYIGTSGFSYPHWRGLFYPKNLPQKDWLSYNAKYFDTVELNVSFYRLLKRETFVNWRETIGPPAGGFVFAIKGNRYITHVKKLKDCREAVERFFEAANGIGSGGGGGKREMSREVRVGSGKKGKTGYSSALLTSRPASHFSLSSSDVVLWQLPPRFRVNVDRLREFLKILPKTWRYAFEFREKTWLDKEVYRLLRKHNAAIVFQDYPGWPIIQKVTADFVYLRFHGKTSLYSSCYTEKELTGWAEKIKNWQKKSFDCYAYFNNDTLGYAVENAKRLRELCLERKLQAVS